METQNGGGNAGEKQNKENMGIPGRERKSAEDNLDPGRESLPSDGPVSKRRGTEATDLDKNLGPDDPEELRKDSSPV